MTMKYYRADFIGERIEVMEVLSETEQTVLIAPSSKMRRYRANKVTEHGVICKAWQDARSALLNDITKKLTAAKRMVTKYEQKSADTSKLQAPTEE